MRLGGATTRVMGFTSALCLAIVGTGLLAVHDGDSVAYALPARFTDSPVALIPNPTAVESLVPGRIAVLEQDSGRVRLLDTGNRGNVPATPLSSCQEIFSWGLRNPFRFAFDPNAITTRFFINDVGQSAREEVNEGLLGANYGWNLREGRCPRGQNPTFAAAPPELTDPITDYGRSDGTY